jgi:multiple sugar transport system ATP-binding protein
VSNLNVQNLSKSFGRIKALQGLTFDVHDGEFMVLLGPTAAGKTTTLRCVAGLEKLDNGTVTIDNQVVNGLSPAERDLALVFQTYALYPRKTTYENLAFPLEARNLSKQEIDKRVRQIADLLQISELLNRRPAQMSGGQQQRVALGRAMVRQPRMFLMDEPLTNLDFKLRVEMRAELKRLQRELATTFFYVTNDQVEAMSMADRIGILNEGVLQQIDTPEAIYNHPANLFVAQFVGSPRMNTLPCTFDASQHTLHIIDNTWQLKLTDAQIDKLVKANARQLFLGVRSEDIRLHPSKRPDTVQGSIYVIEPLGDRTYVDVQIGNHILKVRADADFEAASGDTIYLELDSDRIHVFNAESEATIF